MSVLSAREGYRRWSTHYDVENVVSTLDDEIVRGFGISCVGRTLLDAGCGTGRRMRLSGAARAIGIDVTPAMLAVSTHDIPMAVGDVRALPFAPASFDIVWCRLVIGHVRELSRVYAELARVCRLGGHVVVTDFHPEAVARGHKRTFRDTDGVHEIEHHVHAVGAHESAAHAAGLSARQQEVGEVGPTVRHFYLAANRLDAYETQRGTPLVLAFAFGRDA